MRLLSVSEELKRLSDLLKSGATMLSEACPDCHIPLYKKDDRIFCPKCNKSISRVMDVLDVCLILRFVPGRNLTILAIRTSSSVGGHVIG